MLTLPPQKRGQGGSPGGQGGRPPGQGIKIGMSPSVPSERGLARPHSAHKGGTVHNHPNVEHYDVALDLNVTWPMQRPHSSQ